jgi:hypothetical protein
MKYVLWHGHLTQYWYVHVDTTNVKNIGHQHHYLKDDLKWKIKYIYKHEQFMPLEKVLQQDIIVFDLYLFIYC